ncbi:MAG: hypothetical protein OXC44_00370 [Proteobacteria bacterium]|nr:hypothetical protein [Pseudomonadota bacterium]
MNFLHKHKNTFASNGFYFMNVVLRYIAILIVSVSCRPTTSTKPHNNGSNLENAAVITQERTETRSISIANNPGEFYRSRHLPCNDTDNIEPVRKIVTNDKVNQISRAQMFAKNGLNKKYQYLDCLLWHHNKEETLPYAQRNCGVKFLCNVKIYDRNHCINSLNNAIKKIQTKDKITTEYLDTSQVDSSHSQHPVQKVCTALFPQPNQNSNF